MKNKTKIIALIVVFASLLFVTAYASTSDALANEYYLQLYGRQFPNFNSPYKNLKGEGVVNETTGALYSNAEDYRIEGQNDFDVSITRSYNSLATGDDLQEFEYNNEKAVSDYFCLQFTCSDDGTSIYVKFANEQEVCEADPKFEGIKYKDASKWYWYSDLKETGTGIFYTITNPTAMPSVYKNDSYFCVKNVAVNTDEAFIHFDNGMRLSRPALICYDLWDDETEHEVFLLFQDLQAQTHAINAVYDIEGYPDTFVESTEPNGVTYSDYKLVMVDDSDVDVGTIHPLGFEYHLTLESDDGFIYYVKRDGYFSYKVLYAEDRHGNSYIIDSSEKCFSVRTNDDVIYSISTSGITKTHNDEVKEIVSYSSQKINSEKDQYDKYAIDDEYIFTIRKNSGTTNNILETEEDVTKYFFNQRIKYEEMVLREKLVAYKLAYKIELPMGVTKYIEYNPIDWTVSSPYSSSPLDGLNYPVSHYYECDALGNVKNESKYTYTTDTYSRPSVIYMSNVVRKDLSEDQIVRKTTYNLDTKGRITSQIIKKDSQNYDKYTYGYVNGMSDAKLSSVKEEKYFNGSSKGSHTKNYSYLDEYYLTQERHGTYDVNYTYHTDGNYIPHETAYKTDENTTIRIVNTLTEDKKSIAKTEYYRNDVLEKSISYTYDTYGNIASQTSTIDGNTSLVTLYSYTYADDGGYTLTTTHTGVKDADGNSLPDVVTVSVYDDRGNLLSQTDANGCTTAMTYDNANRLLSTLYPDGTTDSYVYDVKNGITTYIAPNGTVYKAYYDAWNNPIKTTAVLNGVETTLNEYEYDDRNNPVTYKRYTSETEYAKAEYTYDYLDRVLTENLYDGDTLVKTTSYTYTKAKDTDGRPNDIVITQISGDNLEYAQYVQTSNYRGYLLEQKAVSGDLERVNTYANDYIGNPVSVTDNMGNTTVTEYNSLNNPVKVTYADGTSVQTNYNLAGLVNSTVDAMGNTTHYQYDTLGRIISVITPFDDQNNGVTKTYYDANSNVISAKTLSGINAEEKYTTVTNAYDNMNRVVSSAVYPDEDSAIYTRYDYDTMGNPTKVVSGLSSADAPDIEGQVVTYSYDALGRMISTTTPDALTETAHYDLAGRLVQSTDKAGRNTVFTYDIFDNITNTQKGNNTVSYTYNVLGNRTSMTDDTGLTTYTYNPFGELTQESVGSIIKSYTYDDLGRRQSIGITNGDEHILSQTYTYDNVGRLLGVTNGNDTVSYTYDNNSNMLTSSYNGTTYKTYVYNNANLPIYSKLNYDGVEDTTNYMYNLDGNLFMSVGTNQMSMYYYDGANRLVHENTTLNGGTYSDTFSYDTFGNRVGLTHKDFANDTTVNTVYTYNSINQLLTKTDSSGTTAYTYDTVGNMTNVTANGQTVKEYTYDDFNRLAIATVNGITSSYTYNGDNLRQTKTVNGVTTRHIYDGSDIVADICTDTTTFVRGNGLALLKNATTTQLYGIGRRGDVEHLISPNGTDNLYTYTAYGVATGDNNYIHNPFGYAGEYQDLCSGLIYLRNRYYDPSIGRFICEDTHWNPNNMIYGDNQNAVKYAFVDNKKVYYDKYGKVIKTEAYNTCTLEKLYCFKSPTILEDDFEQVDIQFFDIQRTPDNDSILQSNNLYVYCMNDPINYQDELGESATATAVIATAPKWVPWVIAGASAVVTAITGYYASNNQKGLEKGMSKNQKEKFQREIEDFKRGMGRGPGDHLPWEILVEIAEEIRKNYK